MIAVEQVTKYFHRNSINEVLALNRIELTVQKGDFITVIGSNGAGKSTFLNCLAGTYPIDSGKIRLNDQDMSRWPEYRRARYIGRVFQDPMLGTCTKGSIAQNLSLALSRGKRRGFGMGVKGRDRDLFREKLSVLGLGLEDRLNDRVGLLSGGQRQALTMLMATIVRPDVLLLDEHTAALDPKTAAQIIELTETIVASEHLTTLMVTHNMHQALTLGNRLVMLHRGQVIFDVRDEEKQKLAVDDLLEKFYEVQGEALANDRMMLV